MKNTMNTKPFINIISTYTILSIFSSEEELLQYYESSRSLFANAIFNLRLLAKNYIALNNLAKSENALNNCNLV